MYTCPLHSWFSNESPCPACQISVTSSVTSSEPVEQRTFTLKEQSVQPLIDALEKAYKDQGYEYVKEALDNYKSSQPEQTYDRPDAEKVLEFLLQKSSDQQIDMIDGDFYWREDQEGDQPLQPDHIIALYKSEELGKPKSPSIK